MMTSETIATDKQLAFLRRLVAERPMWAAVENLHDDVLQRMGKREASQWIGEALAIRPEQVQAAQAPQGPRDDVQAQLRASAVLEGHYAVASATGSNDLDFYRVDRPTEGKWAGYVFVKRVIGGRPDQAIRRTEALDAVRRIEAAGIGQAATLYGQQVGQCYRCNRHLTDETSRQLGIGPDCRQQVA